MPASMRQQAEDQLAHVPILLLRQRAQPGFEAVAAGEGKSGDTATALLAITFKGRTTTLGIDPADRARAERVVPRRRAGRRPGRRRQHLRGLPPDAAA